MNKFENPDRVSELAPDSTLQTIGLREGEVICDIGAGPGVFTLPAAKKTGAPVYAIDVLDEMLEIIAEKASAQQITTITCINPGNGVYPIDNDVCDVVLMSTVLHEIDDKDLILGEVHRVLKSSGRLAIIELLKKKTKHGPPVAERLTQGDTLAIAKQNGFEELERHLLGNQYYLMIFAPQ